MVLRRNLKKTTISNSDTIQKSNELSMAKMNHGLSLNQMQLMAYAILCTQKNGVTEFHKSEFEKTFSMGQYHPKQAKTDSEKVMSAKVAFEDMEQEKFAFWNIFQSMQYDQGKFTFIWADRMIPHILNLQEKYVLTDLTITSKFNSGYTWILYDYLRAHYGFWYKSFTKEALYRLFSVENVASYAENSAMFRRRVLDIAIEEINEHTELEVNYETIRKGRSVIGFKLLWSTGSTVTKASEKQVEHLRILVDAAFEDMAVFIQIKDDENREKVYDLVRQLQHIKYTYLDEEGGLTAETCNNLTNQAEKALSTINKILDEEDGTQRPGKPVPLHNWLDEDN